MHASVYVVKVSAGEPETGAVDVVKKVEDGKVQLRGQVKELEFLPGSLEDGQWYVVHHRVGALRPGQLWPRRRDGVRVWHGGPISRRDKGSHTAQAGRIW